MDETIASSETPAQDSMQKDSSSKSVHLPQTKCVDESSFAYCESLFQFPSQKEASHDWKSREGVSASVSNLSDSPEVSNSKLMKLFRFLEKRKLDFLYEPLVDAGYDDLDQLLFQMKSSLPLDMEGLESIGIDKYSHRAMLLAALEQAAHVHSQVNTEEPISMCCERNTRAFSFHNFHNLQDWLSELKLEALYPQFVAAGYVHLDVVLQSMNSNYPITDELLRTEVKISSAEDRQRILKKLKQGGVEMGRLEEWEGLQIEREAKMSACTCVLM